MTDVSDAGTFSPNWEATDTPLKLFMDEAPVALLAMDRQGRVCWANATMMELIGHAREELVGRDIASLQMDAAALACLLRSVRGGYPAKGIETPLRTKDGRARHVTIHTRCVGREGPGSAVCFVTDMTERVAAEQRCHILKEELYAELGIMQTLHEIGMKPLRQDHFNELLPDILDAAMRLTGADMGNIQLLDAANASLTVAAQRGFGRPFLEHFERVAQGETASDEALSSAHRVVIPDVKTSASLAGTPAQAVLLQAGVRALQSTPLVRRSGRVLGVLSTHYRHPRSFSERDLRLLDLIARQATDLIAKSHTEQALRATQERLALATRTGKVGIWNWDIEADRVTWSDSLYRMHGVGVDTFDGTVGGFSRLVHPDDRARVNAALEQTLAMDAPYDIEFRALRPDGNIVWLMTSALVVRKADRPVRMLGATMDITGVKHAEQALRESEQRFRIMADSSPVLIWVTDVEGCAFVNRAYLDFVGAGQENVAGTGWMGYVHPDDLRAYCEKFEGAYHARGHFDTQLRMRRKDGEYRWMKSSGVPRFEPDGTFMGYVGSTIDITDLKRAEQKLAETAADLVRSNAELEQFAYVSSHDLQEPLRTISNYVDLLADRLNSRLDGETLQFLRFIQEGSHRALQLIRELLAFASIGAKDEALDETSLDELLDKALENLRSAMQESGAVIRRGTMPVLKVNSFQIVQLFQNLLSNAIKYRGKEPPEIDIRCRRENGQWTFSVSDNGIGIDPQYSEHIFMIFKRLHARSRYPGTGIGLAICKKIVQHHGGSIWVDSHPGRGSTFHFRLPAHTSAH
jgi:PAS domain S-box-containing protein